MSVTNVRGVRMEKRRVGRQRTASWGDGEDNTFARPNAKMAKAIKDVVGDDAVIFVWTETHLQGDELTAFRAYMR